MENKSSNQASEPLNIDAISIDLKLPMPMKEKGKCQHFSIRGYVTETRKKDIKLCSPFGSSSDHIKLPKLDVPKFKWWRCDDCILEIGGEPIGDEVGNVSSNDKTCISGVAYLLTETKDVSNSKKQEGNKEMLYDDDGLILLSFKRDKAIDSAVQNDIVKAVNSSDDGAGLNNVGKEKIGNPVANQLNTSTKVALSKPTLSTDGNEKVASHDNNRDGNIDPREEKGPQNDEPRIASVTSNQIEVLGSKDKQVLKTRNLKLSGLASHELRKDAKTSKGSDENLVESRQCHLDKDTAARKWKMELLKKMCRLTDELAKGDGSKFRNQRRHPQLPKPKEMPHHFSKGSLNEGQVQSYAITPQINLWSSKKNVENQQKPSNSWQVSAPAPSVLGLQHGEGSEPAWFPTGRSITLGQFPCSLQKGKTISDIKGGELESQRERPQSLQKPRNSEHNNKSLGSSRPSSSESIAALQLLGLMDQSTPSTLAFNVDANKLKENPFTPCNYHPQIPLDVQQKTLNGSSLSHLRSKEFSGIYVAGPSSRNTLPNVNDQVSLVSQVKEKTSKSYSHVQLGKRKMRQAASSIGIFRRPRSDSVPGKDKSGGLVGTSCSTPILLQDGNSSKSLDVGASSTPLTLLPVSVFPETNPPCLFNQNPADISSVDDDKSPYIRTSEDQNIQNRISAGEKLRGVHLDGRK